MKFIGELREKLGISIRSIARLLHTEHAQLSRYESHTRNLSLAATPGVTQLFAWLEQAPPPPTPQPTAADKIAAQKKADWCRVQCIPLQEKLAAMQKGERKTKLGDELRRLNDKKGKLEARMRDNGTAALLDTQLDSGLLQANNRNRQLRSGNQGP